MGDIKKDKDNIPIKLYFFLVIVLSAFFTFSQEKNESNPEEDINNIIDDLLANDDLLKLINKTSHFLYTSVSYNSDTYFSGRDIGIDQFNIRPQITYIHSKGFMGSVSGVYYDAFDPNWNYTIATIGYGTAIDKNKILRLNASYTRYFLSNDITPFENALSLGMSLKNKKHTIGTTLSGDYLFGSETSFQITSTSYISFNVLKVKTTHLKLSPQLSLIAGEQTFELAQISFQDGRLQVNYLEHDVFDLINTQINIPLQLDLNNFDIELGYNLNIPNPIGTESNLGTTSFFNLSIGYIFDL